MDKEFSKWPVDPTPQGQLRWAVGIWGPRFIIQADEVDVNTVVNLLNEALRAGRLG